jgi:hypothetical protein
MNRAIRITCAATLFGVVSATAAQSADKPINCDTAEADINQLRHEKKSTLERMARGMSTIMPLGMVLNAARGTLDKNAEMSSEDYNKKIDARILEIVHTCGV